ncbi:MAG: hypothetical protein WDN72_11215 [Alphaproteobacteria bacterium]
MSEAVQAYVAALGCVEGCKGDALRQLLDKDVGAARDAMLAEMKQSERSSAGPQPLTNLINMAIKTRCAQFGITVDSHIAADGHFHTQPAAKIGRARTGSFQDLIRSDDAPPQGSLQLN